MTGSDPSPLRREFFDIDESIAASSCALGMLRMLLAQDGSTTRLCEAIAGGPLTLLLLRQAVTGRVPDAVRAVLPGARFLERVTSLAAHGEVMMDNLSYIALDGLPETVRRGLEEGETPIGHLLDTLWVRRRPLAEGSAELCRALWDAVGVPDARAARAYSIWTPEGPRFVIAETFRRGMRFGIGCGGCGG